MSQPRQQEAGNTGSGMSGSFLLLRPINPHHTKTASLGAPAKEGHMFPGPGDVPEQLHDIHWKGNSCLFDMGIALGCPSRRLHHARSR